MPPLQVRANADWRVFPCGHMTCAECFARLLCARTACCPLCRLPLLERARVAPGAPGRPAARAARLQRVILRSMHGRLPCLSAGPVQCTACAVAVARFGSQRRTSMQVMIQRVPPAWA